MEIKRVGVVGCGLMGSGIAQVCAQSGYGVTVLEANEGLLEKGLASIGRFLSKGVEKGKISEKEKDATLSRIKGTTDISDFSQCDLAIEAVPEFGGKKIVQGFLAGIFFISHEADGPFRQFTGPGIGGHDKDDIAEISTPPGIVSQGGMIHDLQENTENIRVCLFYLI